MFRTKHALVSLSIALVTSALVLACKSDTQATPRVTFDSSIMAGTHTTAECSQTGVWFTIGSFGNPGAGRTDPNDPNSPLVDPVHPVDDGAADQNGSATVSCSVTESGDSFNVAASAVLSGATGGAFTITGTVGRAVTSPNVRVAMTRKGETYSSDACTVTFDTAVGHGIAAGRVWALVDCPDAASPSIQKTCATHAEFRFENCSQ